MNKPEIVLCAPVRTPIGTYGGALKDTPAPALGATVVRETLSRSGLAADKVDAVVLGNVIQAGVKMNPARQAAIAGGLSVQVPALTVNRVCGSGALACLRELGLPEDIVNVEGASIAHGHAIGATGAVLTTRLLHSMRRDGLRRGVVTLCIGGGQGIALALEAL